MAQALRTVWLEPEEQQDPQTPLLRPRRRRKAASTFRQSPFAAIGVVALVVGLAIAYIGSYARIAHYEFQRQSRLTELRQIQEDNARLKLEIASLESTSQLMQAAKAQNLDYPTPDRVHYVRVASNPLAPSVARATPAAGQQSWISRAGHRMVARLGSVFHQLSRGPAPAYAQD